MATLLLPGCSGDLSALDPAGPAAQSIARLWWIMLFGSIVLFSLVIGLFFCTLYLPRFGRTLSPSGWIIFGGLVLPIPILVALLIYAFLEGNRLLPEYKSDDSAIRIEARARQWMWEFYYLDFPGTPSTVNILHIPAQRPIDITAISEDVIHSFWVPRLGGKVDAIPGHVTKIRLKADQSGSFGGVCAEFCGPGHTTMHFAVIAHDPNEYPVILGNTAEPQ